MQVHHAGHVHPPFDVAAAVEARRPHVLADRQGDLPARGLDLLGQLDAGRRGADHHDAAVLELIGVAVLHGREAGDAARQIRRQLRHGRNVAGAAGQDQGAAMPVAAIGGDAVPTIGLADRRHRRPGLDRRRDGVGVALQEANELRHVHVAVGVAAGIAMAGKPALPVGRQQAQGIPALLAPGIGDLAALDQHVVDRAVGERLAEGEPGLAGADDDGRCVFHDTRS